MGNINAGACMESCFVKTFLLDLPATATFVYKSYNNFVQADHSPCIWKYAAIEDGYQAYHGDWLEQNENWPTPLTDTVKKINDMGMQAGIWTMPFLASKASKVFRNHPDWFVHDRHKQPWYIKGWSPEPNHEWADVVLARDENTELTIAETRLSALIAIITGVAFTSDRLDRMGRDRLRLFSLAAKLRIRDIKSLDWENKAYSYFFGGLIDNYRAVAIVNYSEYPQKVKFSELNMPAVYKELLHPCAKVKDSIEIMPHDAALLV